MSDQTGELLKQVKAKDLQALARLLTLLEREGPRILAQNPELLRPQQPSFRVGITGPPGAGKSTLIGKLIGEFRKRGKTVGVMAVDPSSPFTKGAVLGDRIRYSEHFEDPGVFIRSLGSRGSMGGLSASAYLMVRAFDYAGFDVVLLETVGVGQTELEIMNVADDVCVVLVPESGDSIQGMKAGLLEIADLFIVNKSDRPGADVFLRELEASLQLDPKAATQPVEIVSTVALSGQGVSSLADRFLRLAGDPQWKAKRVEPTRLQAEARAILRHEAEREIEESTKSVTSLETFTKIIAKV